MKSHQHHLNHNHNHEDTARFRFSPSQKTQKPQQQPLQSLSSPSPSSQSEPNIISTSTINNNKCPNRRSPNKKRRGEGGKKKIGKSGGRDGGLGRGRQWQLPESSVDEYMKWIQEKPEKDQTSSELQFLWKFMIRRLDVVKKDGNGNGRRRRQERIKEFVERLQARPPNERSIQEEHFVRLYYRRKKSRKAHRKQQEEEVQHQHQHQPNDEMIVSWMRVNNKNENNNIGDNNDTNCKDNNNKTNKGLEPMASLASLRENMMKLGLSSDNIKQVRFA